MTNLDWAIQEARTFFEDASICRETLRAKRKLRVYVEPRKFVCALLREVDPKRYSYPKLAEMFGQRDHTTAINAVRGAHQNWGRVIFRRLAMNRVKTPHIPLSNPQAIHIVASADEIMTRGLILLREESRACFTNGKGWRAA